jgi:hypothetical protein
LVVFLGDIVDPTYQDDYATLFEQAVTYLKILSIPWVSTGGLSRDSSVLNRSAIIAAD